MGGIGQEMENTGSALEERVEARIQRPTQTLGKDARTPQGKEEMNITPEARIEAYFTRFPKKPKQTMFMVGDRIGGEWVIGHSFKGNGFYGSYPGNYLARVMSMFPDKKKILHLFSGSLPTGNYDRCDIDPENKPEILCDAKELWKHVSGRTYDLIIADPMYDKENAKKYGYPMTNRKVILEQCWFALKPEGWLIWLDVASPIYSKTRWRWGAWINVFTSTNRIVRSVFGFERAEKKP